MATTFACPRCFGTESEVIDSRPADILGHPSVRRRRACQRCGERYSTYELFAEDVRRLNEMLQVRDHVLATTRDLAEYVARALNGADHD
jgi:hypothetical protein